jgi:hypothetical protein
MAILEVKTKIETQESNKEIAGVLSSMEKLAKIQEESLQAQKKSAKQTEEANAKASKGTDLLAKGFKGVGLAIKGAGIALLVGTIALLVQAFKGNQKVMDVFASVMDTIAIVGNQVATVIGEVVTNISQATGGFDKLTKVAKGLMTIALTPIKVAFYGLTLGLQEAQLAFEESFLGDKDPQTIKELNKSIVITKANLVGVARDAVGAGSSIVNNFAGALSEIGKVTEGVLEGVKDISIEAAFETAKANKELEKSALLAEAKITGLIEKYDLQAERQRQIRDDETKNISDRIAANEALGLILTKQQNEQTKLAEIGVAAARAKLAIDKDNIEAQVELERALNEVVATAAQVAGFESEQQTNRNALLREQKEIINELALVGKEEFERKIDEAIQEREQRLLNAELAIADEQALIEAKLSIEKEYTDTLAEINKEKNDKIIENNKRFADEQKAIDEIIASSKQDLQNKEFAIANATVGFLNQIASKNKTIALAALALEKGSAIAGVLVNAGKELSANAAAAAANPANAATFGAAGIAQLTTSNILTKIRAGLNIATITAAGISGAKSIGSAGGGASGGGSTGGGARPSADTPRIPDFGSFNQGVGGGSGFQTNRAVVINQDIRDTNAMDNRINDLIKIGK